jgi:xylan 1,4-beta-xylosidase
MIGEVKDIYKGETMFLEGPHIFKRGDYYYLLLQCLGRRSI